MRTTKIIKAIPVSRGKNIGIAIIILTVAKMIMSLYIKNIIITITKIVFKQPPYHEICFGFLLKNGEILERIKNIMNIFIHPTISLTSLIKKDDAKRIK